MRVHLLCIIIYIYYLEHVQYRPDTRYNAFAFEHAFALFKKYLNAFRYHFDCVYASESSLLSLVQPSFRPRLHLVLTAFKKLVNAFSFACKRATAFQPAGWEKPW